MASLKARSNLGQDFMAGVGDQNRVLKLGGERLIAGFVIADGRTRNDFFDQRNGRFVDHRLDGDADPGTKLIAAALFAVRGNKGFVMKLFADTMAADLPHHMVALLGHVFIDGETDIAGGGERPDLFNPLPHRFFSGGGDVFGRLRDLADKERRRRVTVKSVENRRDIDIDDVTFFQNRVIGDAVTDHLINGCAHRLGKAVVAERCRKRFMSDGVLMNDLIDLIGGHTRFDELAGVLERLSGQSARRPHFRNFVFRQKLHEGRCIIGRE